MLSSVTLDDSTPTAVTLHQDATNGKRWLTSATGLRGIANIRDSKRVRPQAHGGINETRYEDGRTITLVGEIMSTVSIDDAFAEWALVAKPMIQTLDVGPALLKWTESTSGNQLQMLVKLDGDLEPPLQEGQATLSYQAQFFAEDPRAYSQTLQTIVSNTLSSGTLPGQCAFTNAGNRPTPPLYRITGQCTNPVITVGSLEIALIGSVASGHFIDIDVAKRTIKLDGTTNQYGLLDSVHSTFFDLPAGASTATLTSGTHDASAKLTLIARSAYA
jgi:hypothetical protein